MVQEDAAQLTVSIRIKLRITVPPFQHRAQHDAEQVKVAIGKSKRSLSAAKSR
jgi:hypothetical protein